jgi:hypothetical protein
MGVLRQGPCSEQGMRRESRGESKVKRGESREKHIPTSGRLTWGFLDSTHRSLRNT